MQIITGVERWQRWSVEEELRIVAETEQLGFGIVEIARRYEISRGLSVAGKGNGTRAQRQDRDHAA